MESLSVALKPFGILVHKIRHVGNGSVSDGFVGINALDMPVHVRYERLERATVVRAFGRRFDNSGKESPEFWGLL